MAENMNTNPESPVEIVTVERPGVGQTLTVLTVSELQIILAFDPDDASFSVAGDDFILTFEDGARIVFQGLVTVAQGADAPTIQIDGIDIDTGVLMGQIVAAEVAPVETAAGEEGEGVEADNGGGSHYDDSFGDVISGLIKQGVIGETELDFGLIDGENIELPVDTAALSNGHASSGGGFDPLDTGSPSETPGFTPSSGNEPAPDSDSDEGDDFDEGEEGEEGEEGDDSNDSSDSNDSNDSNDSAGVSESLTINGLDIITNEASGNLQIPDELILYLADLDADLSTSFADSVSDLSVSGPNYDGATDNAQIWTVPGEAFAADQSFNTWADDGNGHVRFHIGGAGPLYQGSFTYQVTDGLLEGQETIGVRNVETENDHSYWTLDRSESGDEEGEVLLGLDGRNKITGGDGDDIIHGGHDSSGDILMGGDGDDVIFGGDGNDDLQGGDGDDTFIMRADFGRDDVDGGEGDDTITLDSVLTGDDVDSYDAIGTWLDADQDFSIDATTITFSESASGTIDLGGGDVISFENIEQIDYALVG